ncbi:pyruvate kinase [Candidatus Haliotispira prima]|uniref:Pyruvate kinase n=1 Tax=Candidatus Haliotispira prima TaxID=3034016 RepID=A0ABY8MIR4_9SPIO|nr:pyruvate kinase [Candidatus Haliotispira prima]
MESMVEKALKCAPKVVCTIGPVSDSEEQIRSLMKVGMNIVRLNFSHGDHASHRANVGKIRRIAKEMNVNIGILQDLQGPKIRMNATIPEGGVPLVMGQDIVLAASKHQLPLEEALPVDYDFLAEDLKATENILFADGKMAARVKSIEGKKVVCEVTKPGILLKRKGVNMPESCLRIPAMTEKDKSDLKFGIELGVDFVALSFVRNPEDVQPILDAFRELKQPPLLLAKIEKPQAVQNFDAILNKLDGIMVARGDLGVEMPMVELPSTQKMLISKARAAGKFVITATQMLLSMVESSLPTRAEVSDVANAMYDGTDAVMLSDETAAGKYPIESCRTMVEIAESTTPHLKRLIKPKPEVLNYCRKLDNYEIPIGYSACTLAADTNAKFIVACTGSGQTARAVARFRPTCPVIGLTRNPIAYNQLSVTWGVFPIMTDAATNTDELFENVRKALTKYELVEKGDHLVVTAGIPLGISGYSNLLHVLTI